MQVSAGDSESVAAVMRTHARTQAPTHTFQDSERICRRKTAETFPSRRRPRARRASFVRKIIVYEEVKYLIALIIRF